MPVLVMLGLLGSSPDVPASALSTPRFPHLSTWCRRADFPVGTHTVRAAFCRDHRSGREPALVILHGCGGFGGLDHRLTETFPRAGYATLYVDYFGLTRPPGRRGFCGGLPIPSRDTTVWEEVADSAARSLRRRLDVDPYRVGLVGWSMGADIALRSAAAPIHRRLFAVVVAYSPGAESLRQSRAPALPPTLVLLSGRGDFHSLAAARTLRGTLTAARVPNELFVYPTGSHYWQARQWDEGLHHVLGFLGRYLH